MPAEGSAPGDGATGLSSHFQGELRMITVQLFGATRVVVDGEERKVSGVKPRQILEILAANVGQPVAKDRLADLLWDGRPPRSYIGSLESYVCNLRRALRLGQGRGSVLRTTTGGYVLDATEVSVDLAEFRSMVNGLHDVDGRKAGQRALAAMRLVEGELLASESTLLWADEERASLGQVLTGVSSRRPGPAGCGRCTRSAVASRPSAPTATCAGRSAVSSGSRRAVRRTASTSRSCRPRDSRPTPTGWTAPS
jgi:DNA-binding winged helix-turn-helix (wHTH) protein